jgi:hypothetical protein
MGKHQLLSNGSSSTTNILEPLAISLHRPAEHRPGHTTHIAAFPPGLLRHLVWAIRVLRNNLTIEPSNDLFAASNPFVPILPDRWARCSLFRKQINAVVQLPHPLGNLDGGLGHTEFAGCERPSVEVLFKSAIPERAENSRSDIFLCETA